MGKNTPSVLPAVKAYDIKLHTLTTNECQELASKFEERVRQSLEGMINVYDKSVQDVHRYIQWPEINLKDEHPFLSFFLSRDRGYI